MVTAQDTTVDTSVADAIKLVREAMASWLTRDGDDGRHYRREALRGLNAIEDVVQSFAQLEEWRGWAARQGAQAGLCAADPGHMVGP